jgi:phage shock protein A
VNEIESRLDRVDKAVARVADHLAALTLRDAEREAEIAELRSQLVELQARMPTPESLALLDSILARLDAMAPTGGQFFSVTSLAPGLPSQ